MGGYGEGLGGQGGGLGGGLGGRHDGGLGGGLGGGFGPLAGFGSGLKFTRGGDSIGLGPLGLSVKGPKTVPAIIDGPAGKIFADGLYGIPKSF